jgi:hypothetical protein
MGMLKVYCQIYVWNEGHSNDIVRETTKFREDFFIDFFFRIQVKILERIGRKMARQLGVFSFNFGYTER